MSTNRKYELVYIVSPDATEQQVTDLHTQVEEIAGKFDSRIERTENWGRRRLAYEIGHHKEGVYVLEVFDGSGDLVKELDRRLKVNDLIIRHLIVRVDEEHRVVERARARRHAAHRHRPPRPQPADGDRDAAGGTDESDDERTERAEAQS